MDVRRGIQVRVSDRLSPPEAAEVRAFIDASPAGCYLQRPDWPLISSPPRRHHYLCLRAYLGGELVGWALARISPLAAGFRMAFIRRGPVTQDVRTLDDVLPALIRALRRIGICSLILNPRWSGYDADDAVSCILAQGAVVLPDAEQSIHRATLLVGLSGGPAELHASLKQRCRRQIARCEKMGLVVRPAASLDEALEYEPVLTDFHRRRGLSMDGLPSVAGQWEMTRDRGVFLLGWYQDRVICGHSVIADGERAFWMSLASTDEPADMPRNYALVWAAILHAQAQGFRWYDMAGGPSHREAEAPPEDADGGKAGRYQFKTAFAPVHSELVPMMVIPVVKPAHAVLFGMRQRYRALRAARQKVTP